MTKRDIVACLTYIFIMHTFIHIFYCSMFKGGDTTEAKNNTVNEFMYCYQLITYLGHRKVSKKSSGVLLWGMGAW